jgi:hypothetical protein
VRSLRSIATASTLIALLTVTAAAPAAGAAAHALCRAEHHDCGSTPSLKSCCCGEDGGSQDAAGPAAVRITIERTTPAAAGLFAAPPRPDLHRAAKAHASSPPRAAPVDLPILFAAFLI